MKRVISFAILFALVLGVFPISGYASEEEKLQWCTLKTGAT